MTVNPPMNSFLMYPQQIPRAALHDCAIDISRARHPRAKTTIHDKLTFTRDKNETLTLGSLDREKPNRRDNDLKSQTCNLSSRKSNVETKLLLLRHLPELPTIWSIEASNPSSFVIFSSLIKVGGHLPLSRALCNSKLMVDTDDTLANFLLFKGQ